MTNFLSKIFKPVGKTFDHVLDTAMRPMNNVTKGFGSFMSNVGTGVAGLGNGVGQGFSQFGSSLGSTVGMLSNPIVLIGVGLGAIVLISVLKK